MSIKENKRYEIEYLTNESVTVHVITYIIFNGQNLDLHDKSFTTSYMNSPRGRKMLMEEIPEPYLSSILTMWGQMPTLDLEKYKAYESVDKL